MYAHKRIVSVTLDIECYEDLELEQLDWREVLDLQGDETVDVTIKEPAEIFWCDTFWTVHRVLTSQFRSLILSTVQTNPMDFDTDIWQEINDMPGEIFDIPEMQDVVVDFEKALNSDEDFWTPWTAINFKTTTSKASSMVWITSQCISLFMIR